MHGNQKKATAELTQKRTMLSELQVIHEATMSELTATKKRLNVTQISLTQANKIRDRMRLELQVIDSLPCCYERVQSPSCHTQTWAIELNETKLSVTRKCAGSKVPARGCNEWHRGNAVLH